MDMNAGSDLELKFECKEELKTDEDFTMDIEGDLTALVDFKKENGSDSDNDCKTSVNTDVCEQLDSKCDDLSDHCNLQETDFSRNAVSKCRSDERPLKSDTCDYTTTDKRNSPVYLQIQKKERPFQCDTCDCVICNLRTRKFSVYPFEEKQQIINAGRPMPTLKLKKEMKSFSRHFNSSVYQTYQWLTGCETISKLFCWPCLLFSSKSAQKEKILWITVGFSDLNNLHKIAKKHSNSKCHLESCFRLKRFCLVRIEHVLDNQLKERHNELVRKNREIIKRFIDVTCFLGEHELSFGGHNEEETSVCQGNYVGLLNLLSKYDPVLSNHLEQSTVFRGTSNRIQNDILKSIASVVLNKTRTEIEHSKYVSIVMDEMTDVRNRSQLSTVLRYVTKDGLVQERFVGFTCVISDRSAEALCHIVRDVLSTYKCDQKLIAQSYDGAAVMVGHLGSLEAKVQETFKNAAFVHCFAHRLNLVLFQSVSQINDCKVFFETLSGMAKFFSKSTKRTLALDEQIKKRFPKAAPTRWDYNGCLVETVCQYRQLLIDFFDIIVNERSWDAETINSSRGYLDLFSKDLNFNFLLVIFASIFPYTDELFDILQTKMNDIGYCVNKIREFQNKILEKSGQFDEFWQKVEQLNINERRKRLRTDNIGDVQTSYKRLFVKIIDNINKQLKQRFRKLGDLKFLELAYFCNRKTVPEEAFKCLRQVYGNLFDMVALHAQLSVLYEMPEINDIQNCAKVLTFLKQSELDTVYCEVCKLCELVLTIPATSVSVEHNFSILKRIKSFIQNSTEEEERLASLAVISIEKDFIKTLSQSPQFYEEVIEEFLKQERRIDLMYK